MADITASAAIAAALREVEGSVGEVCAEVEPDDLEVAEGVTAVWVVRHAKSDDRLRVRIHEVHHDSAHELGVDPGLVKDGVEAHLQRLLAEHITTLGDG